MKIAIAGTGYVGLANAVLLAQHQQVVALELVASKVDLINARRSPIEDPEIEHFLRDEALDLRATLDPHEAYTGAEYVLIANRPAAELEDVREKVYTRDLFRAD